MSGSEDGEHLRWLTPVRAAQGLRARLICLPGAGCGPGEFREWGGLLGADIELWAVVLPARGRRWREPPQVRLAPMIEAVARDLAVLGGRGDVPIALFGHSMGGLMAFEVALRLGHGAAAPELVCVAAVAPERQPRPLLHRLEDAELLAVATQLGGVPPEVLAEPVLMRRALAVLRADFEAVETHGHAAGEALGARLAVFGGTDDPLVDAAELDCWRTRTDGAFSLELIDGDHFFLRGHRAEVVARVESLVRTPSVAAA